MMAAIDSDGALPRDTGTAEPNRIPIPDIESAVEVLLFSSADPLTKDELADLIGAEAWMVDEALLALTARYAAGGLRIVKVGGGWRMETRPQYAHYVGRLREEPPKRLSRAALEALSIIAYRQPVTAPEIEQIRGVSSDSSIQLLLDRGLVHAVGRKRAPGRPILYATTRDFLTQFGLAELTDLPPIEDLPESADWPGVLSGGNEPVSDGEGAEA
jgi:segregation and condensation protein B